MVSRVKSLLDSSSGTVVVGGTMDEQSKYISPTLLVNVPLSDAVMKDEVCDPIYYDLTNYFVACLFIKHIFP